MVLKTLCLNLAYVIFFFTMLCCHQMGFSQSDKERIIEELDSKYDNYVSIAQTQWENPELGFKEFKSSNLLQKELDKEGFNIQTEVADMPTAFVASYGAGKPVIGILAEFDALPGMSQTTKPKKEPLQNGSPGHACGHHLFGTGSVAAAISVKNWLKKTGKTGTIRVYGTPAEEGGSGKVYMVRKGLFDDVDAILTWHPWSKNQANPMKNLAAISAKFKFVGKASHAAADPEMGRSALDGVEAMNDMVNLLREHTTESTRIHYSITKGGEAPNIVPAFAEVYYVVRHSNRDELSSVWNRVVKAAKGAAMGTETEMSYEIISGSYDRLPNVALSKLLYENLKLVGGIEYSENEIVFAKELQKTTEKKVALDNAKVIQPFELVTRRSSADTGDVSWITPTAAVFTATWVPGTSAHSWEAVAAGGTDIGYKGMMVAAKTLALSCLDIYNTPELLKEVKDEFKKRRGTDFKYRAILGERKPDLDYQK